MKNMPKEFNEKAWDNRELGASEEYVGKATSEQEKKLDEALGLHTISIRLQKNLIDNLKNLAEKDGIGYQPYIRQLLMRHVRQIQEEKKERKHLYQNNYKSL